MAIRVIDDSKLQDIAVAIQGKDGGGTMTVDEMPTRIEQNLQSKAVLDSVIDGSITSIESDVTTLRYQNFVRCTNLQSISFPNVTIGVGSNFQTCTSLLSVYLPKIKDIGTYVFDGCSLLPRIYLPNTTRLGNNAFRSCLSLNVVILNKRAIIDNVNVFSNCPAITYVKPEDLSWYSTTTNWSVLYAQDRIKSIEDLTGDDLLWYQEQLARYQAQTA